MPESKAGMIRYSPSVFSTALGVPAAVVPFTPFTWNVTPLEALAPPYEGYALLGFPFLLGIAVVLLNLRCLWNERISAWESGVCYLLASAALASVVIFLGVLLSEERPASSLQWVLLVGLPATLVVVGIGVVGLAFRGGMVRADAAVVALMSAWLPNAVLCCVGFWGEGWDSGAWVTAYVILWFGFWTVQKLLVYRANSGGRGRASGSE